MKFNKFITYRPVLGLLLLAVPFVMGACSDDDSDGEGKPVITVGDIQPAYFGDSITVNVNCSDNVPLSTLKASLNYSQEEVENVTLRTKENGDYQVKLYIPYYKNIPDGDATLHLTLQNIKFAKAEQNISIPVARPKYDHLTLYVDANTQYRMTPDADNPYLFRCTVNSPNSTVVQAHVIAPAYGSNGNEVTFSQSTSGSTITEQSGDPIPFTGTAKGSFECTFNTLTYEYTPVYDPSKAPQEIQFSETQLEYDGSFTQGRKYIFSVPEAFQQYMSLFWIDPDFFTANGDGTYTFNAVDGNYHLKVSTDRMALLVWAIDANKNPLTLDSDGSGALWLIGSDGLAKPAYSFIKGQGWWTDTDHAICLAQVQPKVYQLTMVIGKQLDPTNVNFKFFAQQGWGTEFKGTASDHHISTTSDIFVIGDGAEHEVAGQTVKLDDGNVYLNPSASLKDGDTYVITVDLTGGCANGVLKVTKK